MMSSTYDQIANIIAETCDIPRDTIKPESHAIDDLGIDSLDFLDIAFAIDKAFGIKMPLEKWTQEVNDGKATTEQYFVLKNLADRIAQLIASESKQPDVSALFAQVEKINHRLEKLEAEVRSREISRAGSQTPIHPSQDRFAVAEAVADSVFGIKSKEKACTFEPNDKPCDHCSMCSSRGF
jgi:acyl carrier protein